MKTINIYQSDCYERDFISQAFAIIQRSEQWASSDWLPPPLPPLSAFCTTSLMSAVKNKPPLPAPSHVHFAVTPFFLFCPCCSCNHAFYICPSSSSSLRVHVTAYSPSSKKHCSHTNKNKNNKQILGERKQYLQAWRSLKSSPPAITMCTWTVNTLLCAQMYPYPSAARS